MLSLNYKTYTLNVLGKVTDLASIVPVQARGTRAHAWEPIYADDIVITVIRVRMEFQVHWAACHIHVIDSAINELGVPAHLCRNIKVKACWTGAFNRSLVLAEDPVLAGAGAGYEQSVWNARTKSVEIVSL